MVIHLGTARVGATVRAGPRDAHELSAGERSATLRLDRPVAVAPGDRFAIRRASPVETLAGGRVLDARPAVGIARRRSTRDRIVAVAAADPGSDRWAAARLDLHGETVDPPALAADIAAGVDAVLLERASATDHARTVDLLRAGAMEIRRRTGATGAVTERLAAARLDALVQDGTLVRDGDRVAPPGRAPAELSPELASAMERLVGLLSSVTPPPLSGAAREARCPAEGIAALERSNRIIRLDDDLAWAVPTYRDLAARALSMAALEPLTPAALRDATGTSRKYVMAILEDLDRRAILRRTPAGHVPGPRAPSAQG